ncbi:ammonia-dependent NAD(+) synthetase [Salinicoccus halitifaciens]|uniref:NH(3)-dependent NAD(+) synthetase n=1 Tax=Salinicoccus halitifaciens TaxID=1073415 RepID=A0ABV2EB96_9STAP|nr:ammonia-dependent NAD(+) synthetase [Salinicoccus halitifaciens]MCD2137474.1 ammonia-dependent NAD(+) synthetase [Salinicoccus halitifaciens]
MRPRQEEIIKKLHVKSEISPEEEAREIIDFIKGYLKDHLFLKSLVLGISGGQDSSLLGKLAQMAVDELNEEGDTDKYAFHALNLPYGEQQDKQDALDAVEFINPTEVRKINIKASVDASVDALNEAGYEINDFVKGNEKARERMKAQYAVAAATDGLVLGTDHAAEAITGFYTKHGDGACDIAPLVGLNKRQGKEILRHLGAPRHLYEKIPTADLESDRPMLSDEEALGVTYNAIDDFLEGREVSDEDYETIITWYEKTEHKRVLPYNRYHKPID